MPTQIREKTYDELLSDNERLLIEAEVSRHEIAGLHAVVDSMRAQLAEAHRQLEAIGAGGVSSQRITDDGALLARYTTTKVQP